MKKETHPDVEIPRICPSCNFHSIQIKGLETEHQNIREF
jgi:hypothetical protein